MRESLLAQLDPDYQVDYPRERRAPDEPASEPLTLDAPADGLPGLPADFRYHDCRHYFASLLIASGADVKVVQARLRHASAKTTLDTYGHLWPDSDDSTRAAIEAVMAARVYNGTTDSADSLRTEGGG